MKKIIMIILIAVPVLFVIRLFVFGSQSQSMVFNQSQHLNKTLNICGEKPNCVSSFQKDNDTHFISPIRVITDKVDWEKIVPENCILINNTTAYYYYECKSSFFGFIDDVEILLKGDVKKEVYFRSSSRVGYSDMEANKKRVDLIKERLLK
jgi:uncharacterized protein (DUF1499 family)